MATLLESDLNSARPGTWEKLQKLGAATARGLLVSNSRLKSAHRLTPWLSRPSLVRLFEAQVLLLLLLLLLVPSFQIFIASIRVCTVSVGLACEHLRVLVSAGE